MDQRHAPTRAWERDVKAFSGDAHSPRNLAPTNSILSLLSTTTISQFDGLFLLSAA